MKRQIFFAFMIMVLCFVSISAQQKSFPKYEGKPETDSKFISFIKKNLGKTVYLKLSITDGDFVVNGYKGVQSSFDGKKTGGIDYSFFLECPANSNADLTPIEKCKEATWKGNADDGGVLSGYFKVLRIIRTSMRNYRAVFLKPVKG